MNHINFKNSDIYQLLNWDKDEALLRYFLPVTEIELCAGVAKRFIWLG